MNDPYFTTWDAAFNQPGRLWKTSVPWLALIGFLFQLMNTVNLIVRLTLSLGQSAMLMIVGFGIMEMAMLSRSWQFWNELQVSRSLAGLIPDAHVREQVIWLAKRNVWNYYFAVMGIGLAEFFAFLILIRF
jgi:hypothetical protein